MKKRDYVLILDFGGTQSQAVARKVRGQSVYCEVMPFDTKLEVIVEKAPKGLILVGGLDTMPDARADAQIYKLGLPILCFGRAALSMLETMGGEVLDSCTCGVLTTTIEEGCALLEGVNGGERRYEHVCHIDLPQNCKAQAHTGEAITAFSWDDQHLYGVQFLPEMHDPDGMKILSNFTQKICSCEPWWNMQAFISDQLDEIRQVVGEGSVLCAMSGGVDSSVCAVLTHKAIGKQLHCLFVDTGLMRKDEGDEVERVFAKEMGMNLIRINAQDRFLHKLRGISDPEQKRKIIGEEFIRVFEDEAKKIGKVDFLVQGTIYPDVIESFGIGGAVIKSHHNVGGLPENIEFRSLIEPVRELFKDEVRELGTALGMDDTIVWRQPFPGPGLAVRVLGEVTREKLEILREADAIFREEIRAAGLGRKIWQYFAILPNLRSVGVRDHARSYEHTIALRAVHSIDAMSSTSARLPYDLLERVVMRITSEVPKVNRVVYDITPKPPSTIEWE